jgi:hypothetical protein
MSVRKMGKLEKTMEKHKWNLLEQDKYKCPKGIFVCEKCGLYKSHSPINGYASYAWRLNSLNLPVYSITKNPGCDKCNASNNKQSDDTLYVQQVYGDDYDLIYSSLVMLIKNGISFSAYMDQLNKSIGVEGEEQRAMIQLMYVELIKGERFDLEAEELDGIYKLIGWEN